MESFGDNAHHANVQSTVDRLSPDAPSWGRLTPDEISNLVEQGAGPSPFSETQEPGLQSPIMPPPVAAMPQQAPYAQPPAPVPQAVPPANYYAPPPPAPVQSGPDPRDQHLYQMQAEIEQLRGAAQRAQAYERWLDSHPEAVQAMMAVADGTPQPASGVPEDPVITELHKTRREMQREVAALRQEAMTARRMSELGMEAQQIREQFPGVDIAALGRYAQQRGIPNLTDALTHAAGQLGLDAYRQQRTQAYAPPVFPQQQQQPQYAPQYAPAPQYGPPPQNSYSYPAQTTPPPLEPPPPNGAVVMRPGMAIPDRPAYASPAKSTDDMFARIDKGLAQLGFA